MPQPSRIFVPWSQRTRSAGKLPQSFHLRLREERLARHLTLAVVAERAGMAVQTLCFLETGITRPTIDHVIRVAAALGVADWRTLVAMDEEKGLIP